MLRQRKQTSKVVGLSRPSTINSNTSPCMALATLCSKLRRKPRACLCGKCLTPGRVATNNMQQAMSSRLCTTAVARGMLPGIAFGDLFLEDVRRYREDKLRGTGLDPLFPIWGLNTRARQGHDRGRPPGAHRLPGSFQNISKFRLRPRSQFIETPSCRNRSLRRERRISHLRPCRTDVLGANCGQERRNRHARRICLCRCASSGRNGRGFSWGLKGGE